MTHKEVEKLDETTVEDGLNIPLAMRWLRRELKPSQRLLKSRENGGAYISGTFAVIIRDIRISQSFKETI